jgi:long-chain acyl-CoA synthetase
MKELKLFEVPEISSIQEMLILSSKTYGDKIALEDLNETPIQRVTYNQLFENVVKFGKALNRLG